MNEELTISTDELKDKISGSLKLLQEISIQIDRTYQDNFKAIKSNIENFLQRFKEIIERLAYTIQKTINSYKMIVLSIPNLSVSLNNFDYVPQGPPLKEISIKEMAIENFKYNIQRYKNSKLILKIKEKFPAFIESLIFDILKYLIFKALGMQ